jgi:hypothetical protein
MPVSVARKIQAHIMREFHELSVRLIRVALTIDQVRNFNLAGTWFRALPAYKAAVAALRTSDVPAKKAVAELNRAAVRQVATVSEAVAKAEARPDLRPVDRTRDQRGVSRN